MITGIRLHEKIKPFGKRMHGIAHEHRLAILYTLAYGELPLHDIVLDVDRPENLVAHHIDVLMKSGWVTKRKKGREVFYRLNEHGFFELFRLFVDTPFYHETLKKRLV